MHPKLQLVAATLAGVLVTLAMEGLAFASMDRSLGNYAGADLKHDGMITRAEWLKAANAEFNRLDLRKDGRLTADELPNADPDHLDADTPPAS